jgi:RNA polymerase-interacting CarD/CdnL/TRCF family regulator
MGDEKSFEDYRKMYTGKELAGCFANLHMTINNEIRTVKQEIKETNERVGVLESHAELVNDLIKTLNEETVPNLEDKLNAKANERIRLELWGGNGM